jgi:hypothetical protein
LEDNIMKYIVRTGAAVEIEIHKEVKYFDQSEDLTTIRYTDAIAWEVIHGEAATQIEAESDGSCIDDFHKYLVIYFANGETSTFRNSYVDMFII